MPFEIERKFLVTGDDWKSSNGVSFTQGYLNRDKARTVRVRIAGEQGFLTIKGETTGATRSEFEYEIPLSEAKQLIAICERPLIQKVRYLYEFNEFKWEIDVFSGDNAGLIVAEIELDSEDQPFDKPSWIGEEVTYDNRYFNSNLIVNPYTSWAGTTGKKKASLS